MPLNSDQSKSYLAQILRILNNFRTNSDTVSGYSKSITDTAVHDVLPAVVGGKNCITHILVTNAHATNGTLVDIVEETSGTILYTGYAAPAGGGFSVTLPTPLIQPTAGKKIQAQCGTNTTSTTVSISGYKI